MRRFSLYLITALLTFSVGSFLYMAVDRVSYNQDVAASEETKRAKAERAPSVKERLEAVERYYRVHCRITNLPKQDIPHLDRCHQEYESARRAVYLTR